MRATFAILLIILLLVGVGFSYLWLRSTSTPLILDDNGDPRPESIALLEAIELGGMQQGC
jgi:hypothetical protein